MPTVIGVGFSPLNDYLSPPYNLCSSTSQDDPVGELVRQYPFPCIHLCLRCGQILRRSSTGPLVSMKWDYDLIK